MNNIDTSQLLAQLRLAAAQAGGPTAKPADAAPAAEGASFSSMLKQSVDKVNELHQTSGDVKNAFQLGTPGVNLSDVMLAGAKADIAFQGMVQVRNKVVEAYQEIMRMPV